MGHSLAGARDISIAKKIVGNAPPLQGTSRRVAERRRNCSGGGRADRAEVVSTRPHRSRSSSSTGRVENTGISTATTREEREGGTEHGVNLCWRSIVGACCAGPRVAVARKIVGMMIHHYGACG